MRWAGQTPHGARPNREEVPGFGRGHVPARCVKPPGRSLEPRSDARPRGMAVPREQSRGQNSAYRSGCQVLTRHFLCESSNSIRLQQISVLRSLRGKGPGMFWKMACQERRCPRGGANSAQISGAPWSNSYALYMDHRRRTQDNDQSNCDPNFSHYARPASGLVAMAGSPRLD
jgi:hypothetical protein